MKRRIAVCALAITTGRFTRSLAHEPLAVVDGGSIAGADSWMGAVWIAQEQPYDSVTDGAGAFSLPDVPPGSYTLEPLHETVGRVTQDVTASSKRVASIVLEMTKR